MASSKKVSEVQWQDDPLRKLDTDTTRRRTADHYNSNTIKGDNPLVNKHTAGSQSTELQHNSVKCKTPISSENRTNASENVTFNNNNAVNSRQTAESWKLNVRSCSVIPVPIEMNEYKIIDVSVKKSLGENVKQKKGISFPKDTYISGYFEPPDPWKNAPVWTTDELISAYKNSCELHGTKPIIQILQQLHGIATPGKREQLLSLKGEKLDHKQCESLEEILRRVQFKLLDLEASNLDDECTVTLFEMIEYYESACQLNISCNRNIGGRGWQACSRLVRRTPTLTYLDMRNCDLNERIIPIFGRALKLGCHLTILHMEAVNLSGRPLVILVAALKTNAILQELFLAENKLMPTDGVQLGNLMRYNHKLNLLDLRKNHLQDVGTSHICDGLNEQNKRSGLRTLILWNNQITYQAMLALGRTLAASESLETLNIGNNGITNEGVYLLKDGLLKTNTLLRLGLQGTKVSDEGAIAIAEYIADSVILLRIDLRDNDIKTGGLMALSLAMRVNASVTRIDLDEDTKKESFWLKGIKDHAEQQGRLQRDILTFQQRNVQAAKEREEAELSKLDERAEAAAVVREEEKERQRSSTSSTADRAGQPKGLVNVAASFTVIEKHEVLDKTEDATENSASVVKDVDIESETVSVYSPVSEETESLNQDEHQRPSQLFTKSKLHPQESLDSPLPTTEGCAELDTEEDIAVSDRPTRSRFSKKAGLSLNVGVPPAEMLLSPQYYPRQLAKKIFSVSRVSEEGGGTPPLSTSPVPHPLADSFDLLNISNVPLVSTSISSQCSSHTENTTLQTVSSTTWDTLVSPATLVKDLTDETFKQLDSCKSGLSSSPPSSPPDIVTTINQCDTYHAAEKVECSSSQSAETGHIGDESAETENSSSLTCDMSSEVADSSLKATLKRKTSETPLYERNGLEICGSGGNTDIVSSSEPGTCQSDSLSCDSTQFQKDPMSLGHGDLALDRKSEGNFTRSLARTASDSAENPDQVRENSDEKKSSDTSKTPHHISGGANEFTASTVDEHAQVPNMLKCSESLSTGQSRCSSMSETEGSSSLKNTNSEETLESNSKLTDSFQQTSMDAEPSSGGERPLKGDPPQTVGPGNVPGISLSILPDSLNAGNISQSSGKEDSEATESVSVEETPVIIDNGDVRLNGEPWLAVDGEGNPAEGMGAAVAEKQPDFLTIISMNGLTQDLASALTSLDGTTTCYGEDEVDIEEKES